MELQYINKKTAERYAYGKKAINWWHSYNPAGEKNQALPEIMIILNMEKSNEKIKHW